MLSFFMVRTLKLISKEDPFFSMTTMSEHNSQIRLGELGFIFAVEKIPPEVGKVQVKYVEWDKG